jgi:hypothetical protein
MRTRKGEDRQIRRLGDHANQVQHPLGAHNAVRTHRYHAKVIHLGGASDGKALGQHLSILDVSLADDDRELGDFVQRLDGNLELTHVDVGLQYEAIDPAFFQRERLLFDRLCHLGGCDVADGLDRFTARSNGAEHYPLISGGLPGDARTGEVKIEDIDSAPFHANGTGLEGIGLHKVGAGIKVRLMYLADQIRGKQVSQIVGLVNEAKGGETSAVRTIADQNVGLKRPQQSHWPSLPLNLISLGLS